MSDKPVSVDFSAKAGERDLEIFLLSDAARKAFRELQEKAAKEHKQLDAEQQKRREEDVRAAKRDISAERPKPEYAPKWKAPQKARKDSDVQAVAEHRVDSSNAAARNGLAHEQRQCEDAFLAQQKEERLLRQAQDSQRRDAELARERRPPPELKRDFDRAR